MTISHLLDELIHSTYYRDQVAWIERLPERPAQYAEPEQPLHQLKLGPTQAGNVRPRLSKEEDVTLHPPQSRLDRQTVEPQGTS